MVETAALAPRDTFLAVPFGIEHPDEQSKPSAAEAEIPTDRPAIATLNKPGLEDDG